ncbi:MAG TPA: hypothetical protein P5305_01375 [Rubrivivax sp.]|nr:hypothetical protein [Rubrivivax sp.]HRY86503.1 hypothetical protein [Rubrivivax sp.]
MNAKKAKQMRRMAREEMVGDPQVDYVAGPRRRTTMVNSPNSVRGMYLQLKKAYKALRP